MKIWKSGTLAVALALVSIGAVAAFRDASAAESKTTQTEGTWVSYDPATKTIKIRVKKPGKGAQPPAKLKLSTGKEAEFRVVPEGSVLARTTVSINGRKGELTDIPAGKTVNVYWIPDPENPAGRFARKIDLFVSAEEQGEDA